MAERSGFFNSVNGDRIYKAEDFAEYFNSFITNGVFPNPSTNLQVIANNDMTVTLKAGKAWINGYIYINDSDKILNIDVADGVLNRIDRIVIQFDKTNREIKAVVKKSQFATIPVAQELTRNADYYELGIADIYIGKGATSITQANITDLRLNTELCGMVSSLIQVDTTTLLNQYEAGMQEKENQFTQDFNAWFQGIKDTLGSDIAGDLLNLIDAHKNDKNNPHQVTAAQVGAETPAGAQAKADAVQSNLNAHLSDTVKHITSFERDNWNGIGLSAYASAVDANGVYTVVDYKRADGTLYMKSTLSGGTSPNYTTDTWQFYDTDGTTVILTKTWTLTYDVNGKIISKVVA